MVSIPYFKFNPPGASPPGGLRIDTKKPVGIWGLGVHIKDAPMGKTYGHSDTVLRKQDSYLKKE